MRWYCHILCALVLAAAANAYIPISGLALTLALLGSVAPDVIERMLFLRHRSKYVHNFMVGVATSLLVLIDASFLAFTLGYLHHLILDVTRAGVYIGDKRVRSRLASGNPLHNALILMLHLLLFFALLNLS